MFTIKSMSRLFSILLVTQSLLALTFSSLGITAHAKAQAAPTNSVDAPSGLSAADWKQIKTLLPAAPINAQQAYIKASNAGVNDHFGASVAVSGDTVVVGAYSEASNATGVNGNQADNSAPDSGAVYVFTRSGTTWSQQAYLKASNAESDDFFGERVAISGDTLVVAAPSENSNATGVNGNQADNSAISSGAVYVFTRNGSTWSQQAYIKASNTGVADDFGASVAISGDTLVVGADLESSDAIGVNGNQNNNLAVDSGAVYVFTRSGGIWSQQAYIKASNTEADDYFGGSVAISGDTLVVGALGESSNATGVNGNQADNSASHSGAAYVFTRSGNDWSQQAYLKASNTDVGDDFGISVAISGDTLVVGALWESSNATGVNGNQADNSADSSGAAYIFVRSGSTWSQQAYLKASNTDSWDTFGTSVAISGEKLVVGADWESSNAIGVNGDQLDNSAGFSGAAYVFIRSGSAWSQQSYLKASNTDAGDYFGGTVAISGDTLIVGSVGEDGNGTAINGDQTDNSAYLSGAAYILAVPPLVTSSLRADVSPTTAVSVDFNVAFSEPVAGVDISDFALTTSSGITGATVTGVSGGPTAYTVTVNTGLGSGAIRLDVVDDDTIVSANAVPLGGAGSGNGDFTMGEEYVVRPLITQIFFPIIFK